MTPPDPIERETQVRVRTREILLPFLETIRKAFPAGADITIAVDVPLDGHQCTLVLVSTDRLAMAPILGMWATSLQREQTSESGDADG